VIDRDGIHDTSMKGVAIERLSGFQRMGGDYLRAGDHLSRHEFELYIDMCRIY